MMFAFQYYVVAKQMRASVKRKEKEWKELCGTACQKSCQKTRKRTLEGENRAVIFIPG
jgi:hypothetical protein